MKIWEGKLNFSPLATVNELVHLDFGRGDRGPGSEGGPMGDFRGLLFLVEKHGLVPNNIYFSLASSKQSDHHLLSVSSMSSNRPKGVIIRIE